MVASDVIADATEQGTSLICPGGDLRFEQEEVALGSSMTSSRTMENVSTASKSIPKGNQGFTKQVEPTKDPKYPFDRAFFLKSQTLMLSTALLGSYSCSALWDSGASSEFISARVASRAHLRLRKLKQQGYVTTAGGHVVPSIYFVRVWIVLGTGRYRVCLKVVDMVPDLILGIGFMKYFRFNMDWDQNVVRLAHGVTVPLEYKCEYTPPPGLLWHEGPIHTDPSSKVPYINSTVSELSEQYEKVDTLDLSYGNVKKYLTQYHRQCTREGLDPDQQPALLCVLDTKGSVPSFNILHGDSTTPSDLSSSGSTASPPSNSDTIESQTTPTAQLSTKAGCSNALSTSSPQCVSVPAVIPTTMHSIATVEDPILRKLPPILHSFRNWYDKEEAENTFPMDRITNHSINVEKDSRATWSAPYKMSPQMLKDLKEKLDLLLKSGKIRPSTSPYGAGCLLVPKPNGSLRLVIDYRA